MMAQLMVAPAPLRVGVYCRISDDPKDRSVGVEAQREMCEQHVARLTRRGPVEYQVAEVYTDNSLSGFDEGVQRPAFEKLLADCRARRVDVVLARSVDRLGRRAERLAGVAKTLNELGIDLLTVKEGSWDFSKAVVRDAFANAAQRAQFEAEQTSERIRDALDRQLELAGEEPNGFVIGPPRAYGFVTGGDGERAIEPVEAAVIREAARRVLDGEPLRSIAPHLTAQGARTIRGRVFTPHALRLVLQNPRLTGIRRHHRPRGEWERGERAEVVEQETTWPRILDRDTFDTVQAVIAREPSGKGGRRAPRRNCLSGLLRCAVCGGTMIGQPRSEGRRRYRCMKDPASNRLGCGGNQIDADRIETWVRDAIALTVASGVTRHAASREAVATLHVARELLGARAKLDDITERFYGGTATKAEYDAAARIGGQRIATLEAQQRTLTREAKAEGLLDPFMAGTASITEAWERGSMEWRNRLVTAMLPDGGQITVEATPGRRLVPVGERVDTDANPIRWRA